jgi:putative hydrolase of the HAD superfamily
VATSLWLVPAGELHGRLSRVIAALSERHGTTPFEPHVTLLGGIETTGEASLSGAHRLAARLRPFDVGLGAVETGGDFYRCVFAAVDETPDLLRAHVLAKVAFGVASDELFLPHLSLVYGALDEADKQRAAQSAGDVAGSFVVDALNLMDTRGDVARWRCIERIPFSS